MGKVFESLFGRFRLPMLAVWLSLFLFVGYCAPALVGLLSEGRPHPLALLFQAGGWAVPEFALPVFEHQDMVELLVLAVIAAVALSLVYRSIARAIGMLAAGGITASLGLTMVALVLFPDGYVADLLADRPVGVAVAVAMVSAAGLLFRLALGVAAWLLTGRALPVRSARGESGETRGRLLLAERVVMAVLLVGVVIAGSLGLPSLPAGEELGLALAVALVLDRAAVPVLAGAVGRWWVGRENQVGADAAQAPAGAKLADYAPANGVQPADPWEHRPLEWMHRTFGGPVEPTNPSASEPSPHRSEAVPPVLEPAPPTLRKPLSLPDRQLTSARLAVLKTSTSILTSGGRAAEPEDVLALAEQLEAWVYRRQEPAGALSSRSLWPQIATNNGS